MKITKHGQSCLLIETTKGSTVLIDPGKYVFEELEGLKISDFTRIDILVITHEHPDHFNEDTLEIIKREKPVIYTTPVVAKLILRESGIRAEILQETVEVGPFGSRQDVMLMGVTSQHGPLPNGKPAPEVRGVIVEADGQRIYDPGDSVVLRDTGADIVAVPIAGTVTTDIESAMEQLRSFSEKPTLLIPIHFDNPVFKQEQDEFEAAMHTIGLNAKYLKNGESIEV